MSQAPHTSALSLALRNNVVKLVATATLLLLTTPAHTLSLSQNPNGASAMIRTTGPKHGAEGKEGNEQGGSGKREPASHTHPALANQPQRSRSASHFLSSRDTFDSHSPSFSHLSCRLSLPLVLTSLMPTVSILP